MTAPVRVFVTRAKYNLMGRRAIQGFGIDLNEVLYGAKRVVTERPYEVNVTKVSRKELSGTNFSSQESKRGFSYPRGGFLPAAGEMPKSQGKGEARGFSSTTVKSKGCGINQRNSKESGGSIKISNAANLNDGPSTSAEQKRANPSRRKPESRPATCRTQPSSPEQLVFAERSTS
ncbi:hypothetical protein AAVH_23687 [Aphelenchoides avenae]|nr:hypothetical protein AAVH_23687 [Aphelenchus avenae]